MARALLGAEHLMEIFLMPCSADAATFAGARHCRRFRMLAGYRFTVQVVSHSLRLLVPRHVREVVRTVQCAGGIGVEASEQRLEIVLR